MKILVIPDKFHPDLCGGGAIYTDMCRGLAARGHKVTVRCPYPFYPEWTDKSGRNGLNIDRSVEEGVNVERHGFVIPRNPKSVAQRLLLDASLWLSYTRSIFRGRFDAVIAFCPHAGGVAFAAMHKVIFGRPLWLNVQDIPADAAEAGGMSHGGFLKKSLAFVQKALFNRADVWSSISPVMIERLEGLRTRRQPILFVPNWLHETMANEIALLPSKVGRVLASPVRLLYAGNIGTKQGLLDFCKKLHESSSAFDFRIYGGGGVASEVKEWVASSADSRFSFAPLLDEPAFVRALHDTDFFVITEKAGSGASFFPSKMAPGMSTGTPTLVVSDGDSPLGHEVKRENLGLWFAWGDAHKVASSLETIGERTAEFASWQANAIRRGRFYDRERCLDSIENTLQEMVRAWSLGRRGRASALDLTPSVVSRPTS